MLAHKRPWLFVSDAFYPDWIGGLQRYATELAEELRDSGVSGSVVTRTWSSGGLEKLSGALSGMKIKVLLQSFPRSIRGALIAAISVGHVPVLRSVTDGVVVAHTSLLGNIYFSRKTNATLVYVFHASPSLELRTQAREEGRNGMSTRLKIGVLRRVEEECLNKADAVVVLSEFSKSILSTEHPGLSPSKITVIPGGSRTAGVTAEPRRAFQSKRLVAVRRLEWRTGVDMLVKAFAESQVAEEGWSLDIVGTGSLQEDLMSLADGLGVGDSVDFHGVVTEEEKHRLLNGAQMFVLPTRAFEGFGLATVEAMAHGAVPIVTSAGASPEIASQVDEALICDPSVDGLVSALKYWTSVENQAKISELSNRAMVVAQTYDWEVVANKYRQLVDSL